jgi:hypothetical protein
MLDSTTRSDLYTSRCVVDDSDCKSHSARVSVCLCVNIRTHTHKANTKMKRNRLQCVFSTAKKSKNAAEQSAGEALEREPSPIILALREKWDIHALCLTGTERVEFGLGYSV